MNPLPHSFKADEIKKLKKPELHNIKKRQEDKIIGSAGILKIAPNGQETSDIIRLSANSDISII